MTYTIMGPLAIKAKGKLHAIGKIIPDVPKHGLPVLLIESVSCINEEKHPVLLLRIMGPEELHRVYTTFNTCFHPYQKMLGYARHLCLMTRNTQDTL